jgi:hypothetical protein
MQSDNDIEMPEAVAYIAAADLPLLKHGIAPISAEPTTPDDIALHTADQLRAAVLRERERLMQDAILGRVAMRFVDRAGDPALGIDEADRICLEFHEAMTAARKEHP